MKSPIHLEDKVAIVTGASRGIGESIARTFAKAGAKVVLSARKLDGLEKVAAAIRAEGGEALAIATHSGDPAQVDALIAGAIAAYGKVDALVNNAATNPYFGPMLDVEWAAFDKTFEVNVKGYFSAAKAVARHLIDRGAPGSIVNVTSVLGLRAARMQGVYGMTKAAVISMTQTLAVELGPEKIRVNAIAPGIIETRFSSSLVANEDLKDLLVGKTALKRLGQPEDIGPLALFLSSDAASYVTGAVFTADGGLTLE
jgi:NAD(P)-dependent dehydrogenase (short-subunit alcohol dehydrogenase family)